MFSHFLFRVRWLLEKPLSRLFPHWHVCYIHDATNRQGFIETRNRGDAFDWAARVAAQDDALSVFVLQIGYFGRTVNYWSNIL